MRTLQTRPSGQKQTLLKIQEMSKTLSNGILAVRVEDHGAELSSIIMNGTEYLWQADPAFWGRHSPVLFPIVGRVWDNVYRVDGKEYSLSQHGFARDMDFTLVSETENEILFRLTDTPSTLEKYPFRFCLESGYRLHENKVDVIWKVTNTGDRTMYFQIGAHPAFYFPDYRPETAERGYFSFGGKTALEYILITEKGCADTTHRYRLPMDGEYLPLDTHTFDKDALILDNGQVNKVTLCRQDKTPWLSLSFNAPVVGLWSPGGKNAPFVWIEPWDGRCDRTGFTGDIRDKDCINALGPGMKFESVYTIEIHDRK